MRTRFSDHFFSGFAPAVLALSVLAGSALAQKAIPFHFTLPTENKTLFSSDPSKFYMYTTRNFEGKTSYPWGGGKFGFARDQKRTAEGILLTRFHEGIDIRPARRDSSNRPLDPVRPVAPGKVVYTNDTSSHSSYGKYVVVEHQFAEGSLYSLYAHLMTITVRPGQSVTTASQLGRLGYTGNGINITRAHVHVELNLMLHKRFGKWHDRHFRSPNYHGLYNGLNLAGIDIASLLIRSHNGESLSLAEFMGGMIPYYRVAIPNRGKPDFLQRYPFLGKNLHLAKGNPSWEIHFSKSGVPLAIVPYPEKVSTATVTWVDYSKTYHSYKTRGRLTGSGSTASLSSSGKRYVDLVTGQF